MVSSAESSSSSAGTGPGRARGLVLKALVLLGGVLLLKRLRKSTTRWDHAGAVTNSLVGEKFSREQARRDPDNYFNISSTYRELVLTILSPLITFEVMLVYNPNYAKSSLTLLQNRMITCPATEMVDGSKVLYFEQAFWRTPQKPFRQGISPSSHAKHFMIFLCSLALPESVFLLLQNVVTISKRFYMVKPCPKEMKCDVELSSYAIRDVEEYKNFCDRPRDQRPQPEEVIGDIAEHLTTIHLSRCERAKRCLYEGTCPPGGFPNTWGGALYCSSELTIHKNGEIHTWDRGYDEGGNQVWGPKAGPYEFKPARPSNNDDMFFSPLNSPPTFSLDKMESSFVVNGQ
ncbi:hypothetical protein ZIOFF_022833 [Zingiber officinale]|uniref:Uncharacterized protein n=1 Tax=Zingiber officinale TaxID=94328 RepID=A0A8J5HMF3_ZINOF|nr:hypothetical protein ZIOFF_022833 [Zingiber officinale]